MRNFDPAKMPPRSANMAQEDKLVCLGVAVGVLIGITLSVMIVMIVGVVV